MNSENEEDVPNTNVENASVSNELEEQRKKNLYLRADFDNFRKQTMRERSELIKFGAEPILREFINILDDLERASQTELTPETMVTYKNGVQLIASQLKKTLEKFGVEEVECLGTTFDPLIHEALTSEDNPDKPSNTVTNVFKRGYKLHGKVIRPAQVVVNTTAEEN